MLSQLFLGLSLVGAEWVLYLLLALSILSITLIIERIKFYRNAYAGIDAFRDQIRSAITAGRRDEALRIAQDRRRAQTNSDFETELTCALLAGDVKDLERATERAVDGVLRARIHWDRNLSTLATIGSNAPFIGLFGTVLGIIKAFHDLSQQAGAAAQTVTAGISEALVATAVGLLVAIPAVVAFNLFSRKVRTAITEAEALKSFILGQS